MHRHAYVSAYVGLNPLFADDSHVRGENVWPTKQVYVLDLAQGIESLYRNLSTNRRRQLRGWRPGEHDDDRARLPRFFVRTYPDFMQRKVAAAYYRVAADTLSALCESSNVFLLRGRRAGRR